MTKLTFYLLEISGSSSDVEKWISGNNSFGSHHIVMLKVENETSTIVWESQNMVESPPYGLSIECIGSKGDWLYVVSNQGIYKKNIRYNTETTRMTSNPVTRSGISVEDQNNIYIAGSRSSIMHYNGLTWSRVYEDYLNISDLYSVTAKNNTAVSVGTVVIDAVYHKARIILINQQ